MVIGIDASNLINGGGVTHILELLTHANMQKHNFTKVVVWGHKNTLSSFPDFPWLVLRTGGLLSRNGVYRWLWRRISLDKEIRKENCDILFVPGGSYEGAFSPYVAMSQNMLPFEIREVSRYGFSRKRLKFEILKNIQLRTLEKSDGYIFLHQYAKNFFETMYQLPKSYTIIPHGIASSFKKKPRIQKDISTYSRNEPFQLLYVSTINMYKHQWNVIEAVSQIRDKGYHISLKLVGGIGDTRASKKMKEAISKNDPNSEFILFCDKVKYEELSQLYHEADVFVFASSCENLPIILLESMSAGLPIVCSNKGPMPDILDEYSFYFNPESVQELIVALERCIDSPFRRAEFANTAFRESLKYSWGSCTDATFSYLNQVYAEYKKTVSEKQRFNHEA